MSLPPLAAARGAMVLRQTGLLLRLTALIVAALLMVGTWIDPNHQVPWTSFHTQFWWAAGALLLAAATLPGPRTPGGWQVPVAALASLALAVTPWLQWAGGVIYFVGDAWIASLYFVAAALALATGFNLARLHGLPRCVDALAGVLVVSALVSTFFVLYQWVGLDYLWFFALPNRLDGRVTGNIAQPNQLAMLMAIAIGAVGWLKHRRFVGASVAGLTLFLFAMPLALSGSRAAWLGALAMLAWLALRPPAARPIKLKLLVGATLIAAAGALGTMPLTTLLDGGNAPVAGRSGEQIASAGTRPLHWAAMADASTRRPFVGYGWGYTIVAQNDVANDHPATHELLGNAHNLFLDLVVAVGLVPGVMLSLLLLVWLAQLARRASRSRDGVAAMTLATPLLVYCFFEFPYEYTFFLLPACLLFGALRAGTPGAPAEEAVLPWWAPAVALLLASAALALTTLDYLKAETELLHMRLQQARVGRPMPETKGIVVLNQLSEFLHMSRYPKGGPQTPEQIAAIEHIAARFPAWTVNLYLANVLARNGHPDRVPALLVRICKTHSPGVCRLAQAEWERARQRDPAVAPLPWPGAASSAAR